MGKRPDDSFFQSKGKHWFKKAFLNNIQSTNISVYRHVANTFFDSDLTRVVWSTPDKMFYKRQKQVAYLKQAGKLDGNVGVLGFPFCSLRLQQDGFGVENSRIWQNQALNVEGMWIEEIQEKLRLHPIALNYEAVFVCQSDYDLAYAIQTAGWDASNETLLESYIDIEKNSLTHTIKNIVVADLSVQMNNQYNEQDWLEKNKIQTVGLNYNCGTWLMGDDRHRYSITKKVILNFINDAAVPITEQGNVDHDLKQVVYNYFTVDNPWGF